MSPTNSRYQMGRPMASTMQTDPYSPGGGDQWGNPEGVGGGNAPVSQIGSMQSLQPMGQQGGYQPPQMSAQTAAGFGMPAGSGQMSGFGSGGTQPLQDNRQQSSLGALQGPDTSSNQLQAQATMPSQSAAQSQYGQMNAYGQRQASNPAYGLPQSSGGPMGHGGQMGYGGQRPNPYGMRPQQGFGGYGQQQHGGFGTHPQQPQSFGLSGSSGGNQNASAVSANPNMQQRPQQQRPQAMGQQRQPQQNSKF